MIPYEFGTWGIGFIFKVKGSIFPKALVWATSCAIFTCLISTHLKAHPTVEKFASGPTISCWASFTGMVGFLLGLRTQIAYSRFWEGGTLLQEVRGVWFNATSNLIAFSNSSHAQKEDVAKFRQFLVRLMSLLYCTALQQVASVDDAQFEVLDQSGIEKASLVYLSSARDRCEVVMQWIQRLIVENTNNSVIPIAPPILSRVFQELSNGIVAVNNAKKIREFPFPFPYAQMITTFLILIWAFTPFLVAVAVESIPFGTAISFVILFAFWSMNYVAAELELPFGDDPNDLPVAMLQVHFNESLMMLLNPLVSTPPQFHYKETDNNLVCQKHKCRLTQMTMGSEDLRGYGDDLKEPIDSPVDSADDEANSIELVSSRNPDEVLGLDDHPLPTEMVKLDLPPGPLPETRRAPMPVSVISDASRQMMSENGTVADLRQSGTAERAHCAIPYTEPPIPSNPGHASAKTEYPFMTPDRCVSRTAKDPFVTLDGFVTPSGYQYPAYELTDGDCKRLPPESRTGEGPIPPMTDRPFRDGPLPKPEVPSRECSWKPSRECSWDIASHHEFRNPGDRQQIPL